MMGEEQVQKALLLPVVGLMLRMVATMRAYAKKTSSKLPKACRRAEQSRTAKLIELLEQDRGNREGIPQTTLEMS